MRLGYCSAGLWTRAATCSSSQQRIRARRRSQQLVWSWRGNQRIGARHPLSTLDPSTSVPNLMPSMDTSTLDSACREALISCLVDQLLPRSAASYASVMDDIVHGEEGPTDQLIH
jgi:hypothetical protein